MNLTKVNAPSTLQNNQVLYSQGSVVQASIQKYDSKNVEHTRVSEGGVKNKTQQWEQINKQNNSVVFKPSNIQKTPIQQSVQPQSLNAEQFVSVKDRIAMMKDQKKSSDQETKKEFIAPSGTISVKERIAMSNQQQLPQESNQQFIMAETKISVKDRIEMTQQQQQSQEPIKQLTTPQPTVSVKDRIAMNIKQAQTPSLNQKNQKILNSQSTVSVKDRVAKLIEQPSETTETKNDLITIGSAMTVKERIIMSKQQQLPLEVKKDPISLDSVISVKDRIAMTQQEPQKQSPTSELTELGESKIAPREDEIPKQDEDRQIKDSDKLKINEDNTDLIDKNTVRQNLDQSNIITQTLPTSEIGESNLIINESSKILGFCTDTIQYDQQVQLNDNHQVIESQDQNSLLYSTFQIIEKKQVMERTLVEQDLQASQEFVIFQETQREIDQIQENTEDIQDKKPMSIKERAKALENKGLSVEKLMGLQPIEIAKPIHVNDQEKNSNQDYDLQQVQNSISINQQLLDRPFPKKKTQVKRLINQDFE